MDDMREMLLRPTKDLIAYLEPIRHRLSKQQLDDLEQLKARVAEYELEKLMGANHMDSWDDFCEFDDGDFANEIIERLEKDYGQPVRRIPKFERIHGNRFEITMIFVDYRMLEATISVVDRNGEINIELNGFYL
jgi:hypothetical protein